MALLFRMFSKEKSSSSVTANRKRQSIADIVQEDVVEKQTVNVVMRDPSHLATCNDQQQKTMMFSDIDNNTLDKLNNNSNLKHDNNNSTVKSHTRKESMNGSEVKTIDKHNNNKARRRSSLFGKLRPNLTITTTVSMDETIGNGTQVSGGKQQYKKGGKIEKINYLITSKSMGSQQSSLDDEVGLPEEQCDIPTFLNTPNCDKHLIDEARRLLVERYSKNPDSFYPHDYERMLKDDWTVSRFLLRRRQDPKRTAKLMEECGRFRKTYKMSEIKLWEFPREFHQAGGLFRYAKDRVGNITLYMRVKMYRRVPEISDVFKAFILCVLEECDLANDGRGVAVIFDLSSCGLQNVDLSFLSWLLSSFRNYCPKGVSYIIVYNLPWMLNATAKLAMSWMSASNRRALRFVHGDEIQNFIASENLPDYLGGTCDIDYRAVPEGSLPALEVCDRIDITKEQALKIKELFREYLPPDDDATAKANGATSRRRSSKGDGLMSRASRFWSVK